MNMWPYAIACARAGDCFFSNVDTINESNNPFFLEGILNLAFAATPIWGRRLQAWVRKLLGAADLRRIRWIAGSKHSSEVS